MINFGLQAWPLILLLGLSGFLTWVSYRHTEPKLQGTYRWLLPGLRGTALALLLALLFEPSLHKIVHQQTPPLQAVLVDESLSMAKHQRPLELPSIEGETKYWGFGSTVRPIENLAFAQDSAPRTNIASALEEVHQSLRNKNLRSILLISDGQYNTGLNPLYVAEKYGLPIHTLLVGDTLQQQDLRITQTATNEVAYVDQEIPVNVTLLLQGYSNETVTIRLYAEDSLITSEVSQISTGENTASLSFIPEKEGLFQYTLTATGLENEASLENNRATFTVRVLKNQQRICIIAGAPHPDVTAIHHILTRNPARQVDRFVQMGPNRFYQGNLPNSLEDYDVIILIGFPGQEVDDSSLNIVTLAAESGVPLLFMLTVKTDLVQMRNAFSQILPALPVSGSVLYDEAMIELTQAGLRDPMLSFSEPSWQRLPPLMVSTGRWEVSADSRVLGNINLRGIALDEPLFVVRNRAGHRTAAILGSGTWRWLNLADDPVDLPRIWPQVIENLMQWLTTPDDDRTVRVEPEATVFDGSESIDFSGQVYDESLNPVTDAVVTLDLIAPDSATYPYSMTNLGSGRFSLRINSLPEGTYSYTAQATRMDQSLGSDRGVFTVGAVNLEYRDTRSNQTLLRQISYRSGGQFFTNSSLSRLPQILAKDRLFAPASNVQSVVFDLRHTPWLLGVIILLLGLEWILRKRCGLS